MGLEWGGSPIYGHSTVAKSKHFFQLGILSLSLFRLYLGVQVCQLGIWGIQFSDKQIWIQVGSKAEAAWCVLKIHWDEKTIFIWSYGQLVCSTDRCEGKIIHICIKKIQFHLVFWSGRLAPPNQGFNSCRKPQKRQHWLRFQEDILEFHFFLLRTHTQTSQCSSLILTSLVLRVFTMTHPGPTFHKGLFQQGFRHLQCIAHPQVMGFLHGTVPWSTQPLWRLAFQAVNEELLLRTPLLSQDKS